MKSDNLSDISLDPLQNPKADAIRLDIERILDRMTSGPIVLDEDLVSRAQALTGITDRNALVSEALKALIDLDGAGAARSTQ